MPKTVREVRRILRAHGFALVRITGSHEVVGHLDLAPDAPARIADVLVS